MTQLSDINYSVCTHASGIKHWFCPGSTDHYTGQ